MRRFFLKLVPLSWRKKTPFIHVVRLEGAILPGKSVRGGNLSMQVLEPVLARAFQKGVAAVALEINCPGGSPVQSALIAQRIRKLSAENSVPVYAFCEDVAASGGYWLACAADEIYADENSIVGSIGVISMGFGFDKAIRKYGVDRRVHTAGESKSTNDPFKPENAEDVKKLKTILNEMHESFKSMVRERRAGKLKAEEKDLFNGAYWTGRTAQTKGLVDGIGHMRAIMTAKFGEKAQFQKIPLQQGWGLRRLGFAEASSMPEAVIDAVENRSLWQRFGL